MLFVAFLLSTEMSTMSLPPPPPDDDIGDPGIGVHIITLCLDIFMYMIYMYRVDLKVLDQRRTTILVQAPQN